MDLYLTRHGQTNYNLLGLCNDDPSVDVHLTAEGLQQAETAARLLSHVPLSRIYVSELPRTLQTAQVINRFHNAPIVQSNHLNDIRSGFESKPVSEYFSATDHDRYNITPPGGESVREFQTRVLKFLDIIKLLDDTAILVVAHEETLRVFYAHFYKLNPEKMLKLNFKNCEVVKFLV